MRRGGRAGGSLHSGQEPGPGCGSPGAQDARGDIWRSGMRLGRGEPTRTSCEWRTQDNGQKKHARGHMDEESPRGPGKKRLEAVRVGWSQPRAQRFSERSTRTVNNSLLLEPGRSGVRCIRQLWGRRRWRSGRTGKGWAAIQCYSKDSGHAVSKLNITRSHRYSKGKGVKMIICDNVILYLTHPSL